MTDELLSPENDYLFDLLGEKHEAMALWRGEQPETTTLAPQAVVLDEKPEEGKLNAPIKELFWKPRGGLWTSTLNDEGGEWLRWLYGEGYELSMKRWGGKLWKLTPREARVYIIWSPKHLFELVERFPHPDAATLRPESFRCLVDWPAMAEEYDAVHIPNPWPWRWGTDMCASMFFYSMDAECTCWFRWCFEGEPEELDPEPFITNLKREE
jgi:hypothetical protein